MFARPHFIDDLSVDGQHTRGGGGQPAQSHPPAHVLQMFDRKIRPMSELFIGLVCRDLSHTNNVVRSTFNRPGGLKSLLYIASVYRTSVLP